MAEEEIEKRAAAREEQRAAARDRWIVLPCIPRVVYDELKLPPGMDIHLSLMATPRASCLTVARRVAPDRKAIDNYPFVAAVDKHGRLLLLYATQGAPRPPYLDYFHPGPLGVHHGFPKAYFICDATTREAIRLPDPNDPFAIRQPGNVGLLSYSGRFYVAELQPAPASGTATLLLYRSDSDTWIDEELSYPPHDRPWGGNGVVSHQNRLWWVDLSYGLLTCDVVYGGDDPLDLHYVPLPQDSELPAGTPDLEKRRCVGVSAGRLRYVQIDDEPDGDPIVRMWTLLDEDAGTWSFDCKAHFKAIWDDEAYFATTNLPALVPAVALVDPVDDGDVVYFFLHSRIFALDVRICRVLNCYFFRMLHPPIAHHSSRFVRAWMKPSHPESAADKTASATTSTSQAHVTLNPLPRVPANPLPRPLARRLPLAMHSRSWASVLIMGEQAFEGSRIVGRSIQLPQPQAPDSQIHLQCCHILEGTGLARMNYEECSLCTRVMTADNILNVLPCGHKFHKECIQAWFTAAVRPNCPFCCLPCI